MNPQDTQPQNQAPAPASIPVKPKSSIKPILVYIVIILLLGGGYYFYTQRETAPTAVPPRLKDNLSDEDLRSLQDDLDRIDEESLETENI